MQQQYFFSGFGFNYIPMAPNGAVMFIFTAIAINLLELTGTKWQLTVRILLFFVLLLALIRSLEFMANIDLRLDHWFFTFKSSSSQVSFAGKMAFPTALNFIFISISALLFSSKTNQFVTRALAATLSTGVMFLGLAFSLGYIYGVPLLYNTATVPVALNTALCFVIIGLAMTLKIISAHLLDKDAAAEALLRARALSSIIESAPDPIVITDAFGRITRFNTAFTSKTGYGDEVLKKELSELFSKARRDEISLDISEVVENIDYNNVEASLVCSDKHTIPVLINASIIKDETTNRTSGVVHDIRDISDLKLSERISRHLASFPENSPIPIVELDLQGNILFLNNATVKQFPDIDKLGIKHPYLSDVPAMANVLSKEEQMELTWKDVKLDDRWFARSIFIFKQDDDVYVRLYGIDITERKHLESIKDDFITTVSHELRTPLSIAKEGTSLIHDNVVGTTNEQQNRILQTTLQHLDRLDRIISDLLDISFIESGRMVLDKSAADLTELLKLSVLTNRRAALNKGLAIVLNESQTSVVCDIDKDKILQVLNNVIDNSIKFTDHGQIDIALRQDDTWAFIEVVDTGSGIARRDMERIFNKFQQFGRLPGAGIKGTGLGLAISKGFIELHNGKINIESDPKKGTKVTIKLPIVS